MQNGKQKKWRWFLVAIAILVSGAGFFAPTTHSDAVASEENPYIKLYLLRVEQAKLNKQRQEALVTLADSTLVRIQKLFERGAVTAQELEISTSEAQIATADLMLANTRIAESEAYLRIIDALVKRGVSIPLCTYELE